MDRCGCHGCRGGGMGLDEVLIGSACLKKRVVVSWGRTTGDGTWLALGFAQRRRYRY